MTRIGLISDTHGLIRPEAVAFLRGCVHIVHAGDIGGEAVLSELSRIAPVTAVRGNNDRGGWARGIAASEMIEVGGVTIFVVHERDQLDIDPAAAGVGVVVTGHSHRPTLEERDGVLFANPGSAGPRRFTLPVSAGEIRIDDGRVTARTVDLLSAGIRTIVGVQERESWQAT